MTIGDRVTYAGRPYVVVAINGDLIVIDGRVTSDRLVRERATVLATDVQPAAARGEGE